MTTNIELRIDGYTLLDFELDTDSKTFYIPYGGLFDGPIVGEYESIDRLVWALCKFVGVDFCDVKNYVALMRPNLTNLWDWRRPY